MHVSLQSHYSMQKGAEFMGLGRESVIAVKSDARGVMLVSALEEEIAKAKAAGIVPMVVNATLGTTVLGAYDPVEAISAVTRREGMWLHVDACLGGALLLSERLRGRLGRPELSDSMSWNWHKLPGAPLLCSVFLTRHKGIMAQANGFGAEYLFKRKYYDPSADHGDMGIQCGRKGDALKVWLMLKARGASGMASLVETAVGSAERFAEKVALHPGFRLVVPEAQCTSVCFWVVPPKVAALEEGTEEWRSALETVALRLKERLVKGGFAMVAYQPIKDKNLPSFFRVTLSCHPGMSEADMDELLRLMHQHAQDLPL